MEFNKFNLIVTQFYFYFLKEEDKDAR